ncbi:hypothetical protein [Desulfolutivibrio sulfoxidireducens]|uniref:hypothetical protein n=1 Tax=Desulfolutivibrio sulfoxidireducens TaxID=2773299 RepID=UPI00159D454C|nr:hypothetical protein [Desulfolutivibrio sulfoxidireducens]QLA15654.1 hypothetical protein GD605_05575 [Desulfolutivibrio sulfoxidireducens]QLA19260.1 hypothetical protein GD604_05610 [Desulfolutivibrio sulfoxidireducens]
MGAILQIRVSAVTFDPRQVEKAWPRLVKLAWPPEATPPQGEPGVLELVTGLHDRLAFGDLAPQIRQNLEPGILRAAALKERLEQSLAARDPKTADSLSYQLEDVLLELERHVG